MPLAVLKLKHVHEAWTSSVDFGTQKGKLYIIAKHPRKMKEQRFSVEVQQPSVASFI